MIHSFQRAAADFDALADRSPSSAEVIAALRRIAILWREIAHITNEPIMSTLDIEPQIQALEMELIQLRSSNHALTLARDENATCILELRDKLFAYQTHFGQRDALCFLCQTKTDSIAANPGRWPVYLGVARNAHVECVNLVLRGYEAGRATEATLPTHESV